MKGQKRISSVDLNVPATLHSKVLEYKNRVHENALGLIKGVHLNGNPQGFP